MALLYPTLLIWHTGGDLTNCVRSKYEEMSSEITEINTGAKQYINWSVQLDDVWDCIKFVLQFSRPKHVFPCWESFPCIQWILGGLNGRHGYRISNSSPLPAVGYSVLAIWIRTLVLVCQCRSQLNSIWITDNSKVVPKLDYLYFKD